MYVHIYIYTDDCCVLALLLTSQGPGSSPEGKPEGHNNFTKHPRVYSLNLTLTRFRVTQRCTHRGATCVYMCCNLLAPPSKVFLSINAFCVCSAWSIGCTFICAPLWQTGWTFICTFICAEMFMHRWSVMLRIYCTTPFRHRELVRSSNVTPLAVFGGSRSNMPK